MTEFDLIVLGSGPGGYIAAIRGAQLGLSTAVIEKDIDGLGGTCLRRGCVPAKTWLETAHRFEQMSSLAEFGIAGLNTDNMYPDLLTLIKRKNRIIMRNSKGIEFLMKKNKVTVLKGQGKLSNANTVEVYDDCNVVNVYSAKKIILATGSIPNSLQGIMPNSSRIINSNQILDLTEIPEHLAILGAGAIGVEFASVFSRLGSKVTLIDFMDTLLPIEDRAIGIELAKIFNKKYKINIKLQTKIASVKSSIDGNIVCSLDGVHAGILECSHLLVAIGRTPVTDNIGLENTNIIVENKFIPVDKYMRTIESDIYAIGDVVKTPMLAHIASDEGIVAAEHIANILGKNNIMPHTLNYELIPSCTYCDPEIGCIGLSEDRAREKYGDNVSVGVFPFMPLAKANIIGEPNGFMKIVADKISDKILGIHIIGPKATELISSSVALMGGEFTVSKLIHTVYPHPTLNEIFPEAARSVYNMALNA